MTKKPNKYDLAFWAWFRQWGWRIYRNLGVIQIWTNHDAHCPFKVTSGMIERLEKAKKLQRVFFPGEGIFDEWWILS